MIAIAGIFGPSIKSLVLALVITSWAGFSRIVRAEVMQLKEEPFIEGLRCLGCSDSRLLLHHIIPNIVSVILVSMTLSFASSMLTEASLSYLGFGISPPTPTWGNMLTGANDSIVIQQYWWRWLFTAIIFSICTICINLIGDGLRDAIDPKSNDR